MKIVKVDRTTTLARLDSVGAAINALVETGLVMRQIREMNDFQIRTIVGRMMTAIQIGAKEVSTVKKLLLAIWAHAKQKPKLEKIATTTMITPASLVNAVVVASVPTMKVGCLMATTVTKTVIAKAAPTVTAVALTQDLAHPEDAQQRPRLGKIATMTTATHVLLGSAAVVASVLTHMESCRTIIIVTQMGTVNLTIAKGATLTAGLVQVEPAGVEERTTKLATTGKAHPAKVENVWAAMFVLIVMASSQMGARMAAR